MPDAAIKWIMMISGVLTLTTFYAAVLPVTASQSMFGETPQGAMASIIVPNWGVLVALMGGLLLYGAVHVPARRLALVIAGASKIAFIALVLMQGGRYLGSLGIVIAFDSVTVVLFALYLIFAPRSQ